MNIYITLQCEEIAGLVASYEDVSGVYEANEIYWAWRERLRNLDVPMPSYYLKWEDEEQYKCTRISRNCLLEGLPKMTLKQFAEKYKEKFGMVRYYLYKDGKAVTSGSLTEVATWAKHNTKTKATMRSLKIAISAIANRVKSFHGYKIKRFGGE